MKQYIHILAYIIINIPLHEHKNYIQIFSYINPQKLNPIVT